MYSWNFSYVYQYKDHLGNVRLTYCDADGNGSIIATEVLEESNYYAFGLQHKGYNTNVYSTNPGQKHKYNGMEWQDELDLNMYDMPFRDYDPAIARWVVVDPVIHFDLSTYNGFDNNPVFWADPSGADSSNMWLQGFDGEWHHVNGSNFETLWDSESGESFDDWLNGSQDYASHAFGGDGGVIAKGGNVNGLDLTKLLGYKQTGYFIRESIKGRLISHEDFADFIEAEVNHLLAASKILSDASYITMIQSLISKNNKVPNAIIKDYIPIGKLKVPITIIIGVLLKYESSQLSAASKEYLSAAFKYMNSGNTKGIYFIQKHSAVMPIPFWENISNSMYDASTGMHLGSVSQNYF